MARGFHLLFAVALLLTAQTPRIRVDTRLVEINVIVRDKNNRPVDGLTKSDFTLFDRNKPQNIALFSAISMGAVKSVPARLPQGIYTNRPEQHDGAPPAITVVLLDAVNTSVQDQMYAKKEFVKFLGQLRPEDRVAVYALGTELRVLHDFTNDSKSLIDTITKNSVGAPSPGSGRLAGLDSWLSDKTSFPLEADAALRVRATVSAMKAIANHIGHTTGRKNLIWVTGGFPFLAGRPAPVVLSRQPIRRTFVEFGSYVSRAIRALNDANIAVYPVDARGLIGFSGVLPAQSEDNPKPRAGAPVRAPAPPEGIDVMNVIAENTGGRAYYNSNDIQHAIRDAIEDSELTYTLGFYADAAAHDVEFRDLKVQVDRKDVELRYRRGYLAAPAAAASQDNRDAAVKDALLSPLDAAGISLAGRLVHLPPPKTDSVQVLISPDPSELMFEDGGAKSTLSVEFTFALMSKTGLILDQIRQVKTLALDAAQRQEFQKEFVVDKTIDLKPEAAQIRVVLLDRTSGRLGSLTLPVR